MANKFGGAKRTKEERERDFEFISSMHLRGKKAPAIREALNAVRPYKLSEAAIRNDIKEIRTAWWNSMLVNFDQAKREEIARLFELERAYWEGWEASRLPKIKNKDEKKKGAQATKGGKPQPAYIHEATSEEKEQRDGDPAFLAGVFKCIEARVRIFGLFAPDKLEVDWQVEAKKFGIDTNTANDHIQRLHDEFVSAAEKGLSPAHREDVGEGGLEEGSPDYSAE